jgi:UDP-glucose 4-epimerase
MTNFVLLGGNGYLGRNFTKYAQTQDPTAHFYVVSRSGKNELRSDNITNIAADLTQDTDIPGLPDQIDYVVDFVGGLVQDPEKARVINFAPARLMRKLAESHGAKAMGYIGGSLGPEAFIKTKKEVIAMLQKSAVQLAYVEPTLVYGAGRDDKMMKMIPKLKFLGIFSKKFRPVKVDKVAKELWEKLVETDAAEQGI